MLVAQVLSDWLPYVTAIFASIAAFAAILNLWYGAIRGPVINLAGKPDFVLHDVPVNAFAIPMSVQISPSFVFVNSGSATAMIRLTLSFSPTPALEILDCCKRFTVSFEDNIGQTKEMQHLFLRERESGVVKTQLIIGLGDWKSYVRLPAEADETSICPTLHKADEANKERYSKFCAELKKSGSLGTLRVDCTRTKRQWVRSWRVLKRKDVIEKRPLFAEQLLTLDDPSIQAFASYLDNWDRIQPNQITELLREIEPKLKLIFSWPEHDYCEMLNGQINREKVINSWDEHWDFHFYGRDDQSDLQQRRNRTPARYVLDFILTASVLDRQMQEFSEKAKVYNYSCQLRDRLRTGSQELNDLLKSLDKQKQELISLNVAIRETGDGVTQIIKNCIAETLPT
jgi:hypothetical protein